MKIQTVSQLTKLTIPTIRYYDAQGLLCTIPRDANGFRNFREVDVQWLKSLEVLRKSNVSIATLKKIAQLNHHDPQILVKRSTILTNELKKIDHQISKLERAQQILKEEINHPTFVD